MSEQYSTKVDINWLITIYITPFKVPYFIRDCELFDLASF